VPNLAYVYKEIQLNIDSWEYSKLFNVFTLYLFSGYKANSTYSPATKQKRYVGSNLHSGNKFILPVCPFKN